MLRRIALAVGHLWASPLTALGLLVALVGRCRWIGGLEFVAEPGGLVDRVFRRTRTVGASGVWGEVVFFGERWKSFPTPLREMVRRHEAEHSRQSRVWGLLFPLAYLVAGCAAAVRGGSFYRDNWFEREARAAEARALEQ